MKKAIIAIVVGLVIVAMVIAFGHVFAVRYVSVEFQNNVACTTKQEILSGAEISSGTNIFVVDEKKVMQRIERQYEDSDIKVVDIVREFPNKITIKVMERFAIFKIDAEFMNESGYVCVDRNFQRTKIYNSGVIQTKKLIDIVGYKVSGTYVTDECYRLRDIANAFIACGIQEEALPYFVSQIEFTTTQTLIKLRTTDTLLVIESTSYDNVKSAVVSLYQQYLALNVNERDKISLFA